MLAASLLGKDTKKMRDSQKSIERKIRRESQERRYTHELVKRHKVWGPNINIMAQTDCLLFLTLEINMNVICFLFYCKLIFTDFHVVIEKYKLNKWL